MKLPWNLVAVSDTLSVNIKNMSSLTPEYAILESDEQESTIGRA